MYRSYEYHSSSSSYSATDEYIERLNRIERMPSMIADTPLFPNVHEIFNDRPVYVEENNDHQKMIVNKNHNQKKSNRGGPHEVQKKVHFAEQEKKKQDGVEEKKIDEEAERFIQQKHKGFELCKWNTFKVY